MSDAWTPPAEAKPVADPWAPPGDAKPVADPWTPPASAKPTAAPASPAADTPGFINRADELLSNHPVYNLVKDVVPPVANFLVADPIRNLAADVVGGVRSPPFGEKGREGFWREREKSLEQSSALRVPETETGQAITAGVGAIGSGLAKALGAGSEFVFGEQPTAAMAPFATGAADVLPFAGGLASALRGPGAPKAAVQAAKAENRARATLSDRFQAGLYEGGGSALDAVEELQKARAAGQPMTLLDVNNPELRGEIGTVYRQGGAAQGRISDFLEGRHREQVPRTQQIIGEGLGDANTFRQTADQLKERRSQNARPLFEAAAEGPGLKALEHEFTEAFNMAGRTEREAAQRVTQAEAALTQARGRQSTAGNVYATSGANAAEREAQAAMTQAQSEFAQAQQRKTAVQDLMRQAQQDGTWRPDAVWSPYLDMLRKDNPHVRRGISRGWDIERNKAHGEGKQPNPRDYAIVGFDDAGKPIVGAVPNMRLWMVAKEGLDAAIEKRINRKGGEVDKTAHALIQLRDGLLTELDRLNPRYRAAREMWQGDSASKLALDRGEHLFDPKWFKTDADVQAYLGGLNPADREFVKLGLAQKMLADVRRAPDAADKAKRVVNTDVARGRLEMLLGPDADRFLQAVEREADMERSRFGLKGGSQTRDKGMMDERNARRIEAAGGAIHQLFHGNIPGALYHAMRGLRRSRTPDMPANEAVSRLVTDPNIALNAAPGGPILPPGRVPTRYKTTPGRVIVGSELAMPHEDDALTRAFGGY